MRTIEFDYISDIHLDSWVDPRSDRHATAVRKFVASRMVKECRGDRPSVLVVAGDVSHCNAQIALFAEVLLDNYYKSVIMVPGNHDMASIPGLGSYRDYKARLADIRTRLARMNGLHYLQGESIALDGVRYGGISGWSDYSYSIKTLGSNIIMGDLQYLRHWDSLNVRLPGGTPHTSPLILYKEQEPEIRRLAAEADVMITHFGPIADHIPQRYAGSEVSGFFYFDGSSILEHRGAPAVWVYGHTHTEASFTYGSTDLVCNPLGRNGEGTPMTGIVTYRRQG